MQDPPELLYQGSPTRVPQPGFESVPLPIEVQILNHWNTREVPAQVLIKHNNDTTHFTHLLLTHAHTISVKYSSFMLKGFKNPARNTWPAQI